MIAALGIAGFAIVVCSESPYSTTQRQQARNDARTIQAAAKSYREHHPTEACPRTKDLPPFLPGKGLDPWDTPFKIVCGSPGCGALAQCDVSVISFGPDKTEGTSDDIHN